jgi:hypothetical protein
MKQSDLTPRLYILTTDVKNPDVDRRSTSWNKAEVLTKGTRLIAKFRRDEEWNREKQEMIWDGESVVFDGFAMLGRYEMIKLIESGDLDEIIEALIPDEPSNVREFFLLRDAVDVSGNVAGDWDIWEALDRMVRAGKISLPELAEYADAGRAASNAFGEE